MNFHYVTGLHRAGTHSIAKNLAHGLGLPFIEESFIGMDSLATIRKLEKASEESLKFRQKAVYIEIPGSPLHKPKKVKITGLHNGFVCQCPFLAHEVPELSKNGKVYWCKRRNLDVVTSMRNGNFEMFSWKVMNAFHDKYPDDPIWETLEYNGKIDVYGGFINHYALLLRVKDYFLEKYFMDQVSVIQLENMPFYNHEKSLTSKKPLKNHERSRLIL